MKTAVVLSILVLAAAPGARAAADPVEKDFAKAEALLEKGSYPAARQVLDGLRTRLRSDDPRTARIHERLGAVKLREGKTAEARASFTAALKAAQKLGSDQSTAMAYTGMGLCLRREKNDAYALKFFKKALKAELDEGTRMFVEDQIREIEGDPPLPAR